jgi:predicted Zn-dependent peptidase
MTTVRTERLANGLTAVLVQVPTSHQVLVSLTVRAGSRLDPPQQAGASHFLEHLLFRGNAVYPDVSSLFESFERAGEVLNAQTGVEYTEYYQTVHPDLLPDCLASLAAFIRTPRFSDFEKERRIVLDEILYDYNDQGEMIRLDAVAGELLWPGHSLSQPITGTRDSVSAFTEASVRAHYAAHYRPGNLVLGLAGNLDPARALDCVQRGFGDWPAQGNGANGSANGDGRRGKNGNGLNGGGSNGAGLGLMQPPVPKLDLAAPTLRMVHDADNQLRIQFSFPVEGYRSDREIPLSLLTSVLDDGPNSRLQRTIREELALVYYIGCTYTGYCDAGQIDITTAVSRERLEDLLASLIPLLRQFREGGVTEAELEAVKRRYRFDLEFSRDSLDAALDRYAWSLLFSEVRTEEEEWTQVQALTAPALSALAQEALSPRRLHVAVVGPVDDEVQRLLRTWIDRY